MKKKTGILLSLALLIVLVAGYSLYQHSLGNQDTKQITIVMKNKDDVFYEKTVQTQTSTLSELLNELKDKNEILMESENSAYGMYITALGKDELVQQDPSSSLYWTYRSDNNKQCLANTYCDAADVLVIEDGDVFEFVLDSYQ